MKFCLSTRVVMGLIIIHAIIILTLVFEGFKITGGFMAKTWTAEEEQFLIENYTKMSNAYLADHFGVTAKSISHKMRRIRDRMAREQQKRSAELEHIRHLEKEQAKLDQLQMDNLIPVNLPEFEHIEKEIQENGCCEKLISTPFFVKTEGGWAPLMIHKKRLITS